MQILISLQTFNLKNLSCIKFNLIQFWEKFFFHNLPKYELKLLLNEIFGVVLQVKEAAL